MGQVYIFLGTTPMSKTEWRQNIGGRELRRENLVQIFAQRSCVRIQAQANTSSYISPAYVDLKIIANVLCLVFLPLLFYGNQPLHFGLFLLRKCSL